METTLEPRRSFAVMAILIFIAGLAVRMTQAASDWPIPYQPRPTTVPPTQPAAFLRVEWMTPCNGLSGVGLYGANDQPCQPGLAMPLQWLQSQMTTRGLLASGEYLEGGMTHPTNAACGAAILVGPGKPAGWLCADWGGVYRTDASGQNQRGRLQYWSNETWVQSQ